MNKHCQKTLESAYDHIISEFGLENVKPSLQEKLSDIQSVHNSIHEFIYLMALLAPSSSDKEASWDWHSKSAFLVYQWEVFNYAHRSHCEALCTYYNIAFVLLRIAFESLIKGAFWECLSHRGFRENSPILDRSKCQIKEWLKMVFEKAPDIEDKLEETSAVIYDKISPIIEDFVFRPSIRTMISQLDDWGMFSPISDAETNVYKAIYGKLSGDVHVVPDSLDIGRRLNITEIDIFEQTLLPHVLQEYLVSLHKIMDLAIVVELNIMADLIEHYEESRTNIEGRLEILQRLGLKNSYTKAKQLLMSAAALHWAENVSKNNHITSK